METRTACALTLSLGLLAGCKSATTAPLVQAPPRDITLEQVRSLEADTLRTAHRIDLALDRIRPGQLSDQDFVELRAQLHKAIQSNTAALKMARDMKEAEDEARITSGLAEPPMTAAQRAERLAELRRSLDDVRERKAALQLAQAGPGK